MRICKRARTSITIQFYNFSFFYEKSNKSQKSNGLFFFSAVRKESDAQNDEEMATSNIAAESHNQNDEETATSNNIDDTGKWRTWEKIKFEIKKNFLYPLNQIETFWMKKAGHKNQFLLKLSSMEFDIVSNWLRLPGQKFLYLLKFSSTKFDFFLNENCRPKIPITSEIDR